MRIVSKIFQTILNIFLTAIAFLWLLYIGLYVDSFKVFTFQIFLHFFLAFLSLIILWFFIGNLKKYIFGLTIFFIFAFSIFLPDVLEVMSLADCYEDENCTQEIVEKYGINEKSF